MANFGGGVIKSVRVDRILNQYKGNHDEDDDDSDEEVME